MKQETKFKQTEIGNIPEDWEVKTIDEVKSNKKYAITMGPFGSNIKKENFVPFGVPVIRGSNLSVYKFLDEGFVFVTEEKADELKASNAVKGDIIITHRGTLGQVGIIPNNPKYARYIVSQSGMKLTCDSHLVDNEFVFYYLKSKRGQHELLKNKSQTGVPAIAQPSSSLKQTHIPIPELVEQHSIAKILSDIDTKIELLQKQNKTLEAIAQVLFKHWFIDFEFPNEEGKPYKSSGGEMVDSELGEIPKGWEVGKLGDFINITSGKRPEQKSEVKDSVFNVPLVGASSVMGFVMEPLFKEPVLIIGRVGTHSDNTLIIRSPFYEYVYQVLKRIDYASLNVGSTQPLITQSSIKNYTINTQKENILSNFENTVSVLFAKGNANNHEIENLSKIRDTLLPKLMSGMVRIDI
jgi:type I restriction enzyme S subunit